MTEQALPELPEPDFWVSVEPWYSGGGRMCFKTENQVSKRGKEQWFQKVWTHDSLEAFTRLAVEQATERLRAELEGVRKDARRYTGLIESSPNGEICFMGQSYFGKVELDEAIDAAIEQSKP